MITNLTNEEGIFWVINPPLKCPKCGTNLVVGEEGMVCPNCGTIYERNPKKYKVKAKVKVKKFKLISHDAFKKLSAAKQEEYVLDWLKLHGMDKIGKVQATILKDTIWGKQSKPLHKYEAGDKHFYNGGYMKSFYKIFSATNNKKFFTNHTIDYYAGPQGGGYGGYFKLRRIHDIPSLAVPPRGSSNEAKTKPKKATPKPKPKAPEKKKETPKPKKTTSASGCNHLIGRAFFDNKRKDIAVLCKNGDGTYTIELNGKPLKAWRKVDRKTAVEYFTVRRKRFNYVSDELKALMGQPPATKPKKTVTKEESTPEPHGVSDIVVNKFTDKEVDVVIPAKYLIYPNLTISNKTGRWAFDVLNDENTMGYTIWGQKSPITETGKSFKLGDNAHLWKGSKGNVHIKYINNKGGTVSVGSAEERLSEKDVLDAGVVMSEEVANQREDVSAYNTFTISVKELKAVVLKLKALYEGGATFAVKDNMGLILKGGYLGRMSRSVNDCEYRVVMSCPANSKDKDNDTIYDIRLVLDAMRGLSKQGVKVVNGQYDFDNILILTASPSMNIVWYIAPRTEG